MSLFDDFYNPIYLIIKCEEIYNIILFDEEAICIESGIF
jgi:hypothetical protein